MRVSQAIEERISCRAFLSKPVSLELLKTILMKAGRSPSGGNLQPWHVFVISGNELEKLLFSVQRELEVFPKGHPTEYSIYPRELGEVYRSRRFKCGEDMYSILKIGREEKEKRRKQFAKNFVLFGAPVGLFVFIDRNMGLPQWSDVGMYLQNIFLLSKEYGLDTCAQESWAVFHELVQAHVEAPKNLMLFCGVAIGYMDQKNPINSLRTERAPVREIANFIGFKDLR